MAELVRIKNFLEQQRAAKAGAALGVQASPYDQSAWAILYGALVSSCGVDPTNFQLVYPFIAWDWPSQSLGYIGPGQYDTLSTIPARSAVGQYTSTGTRFNDMYRAFLNVILADTSDPALRKKIDGLWNLLVEATNTYDRTLQQAKDAYDSDTDPKKPDFTTWLGTITGKGWQTKLNAGELAMTQAEKNYDAAVGEAHTPNLDQALAAYADHQYWSQLNDSNLKAMPPVPNWSTPVTAQDWRDRAARGEVPSGGLDFSNGASAYDFSKTWAKGSAEVGSWFWSVRVGTSWERIDVFESDAELNASMQFQGIEQISVQPSPWYTGVLELAKGPYMRGYSEYGADGTTAVFGDEGFLPMIKTGMYAIYKPSFSIAVNKSTFDAFSEKFKACTALRIGPFTMEAEGGIDKAGWTLNESAQTFTGKSTSDQPFIAGFTVQMLP